MQYPQLITLKYAALAVILLLSHQSLLSQDEPCGTETVDYEHYNQLKSVDDIVTRDEYIMPIVLHIVAENNGQFEANVDDIIDEIRLSSGYFESQGITLKLCKIQYINNSILYDFDKSTDFPLISTYNENDVLNLYIVETLVNESGNSICGTAFYPWATYDIVIAKNSCATNGSSIAHEIGHYLGLYHTHDNRFGYELVDQSNCHLAGDRVCDTPADPKLSSDNLNNSCIYFGNETDSNGAPYTPDTELIMSYSKKWCRTIFTDEQGVIMRNVCDQYYPTYMCEEDITSSNTPTKELKVSVFPNPTSEILNITIDSDINFYITLYSLQGKVIRQWTNEKQLKLHGIAEGIYLLEIESAHVGYKSTQSIVISR